jgi:hypothetical protein
MIDRTAESISDLPYGLASDAAVCGAQTGEPGLPQAMVGEAVAEEDHRVARWGQGLELRAPACAGLTDHAQTHAPDDHDDASFRESK